MTSRLEAVAWILRSRAPTGVGFWRTSTVARMLGVSERHTRRILHQLDRQAERCSLPIEPAEIRGRRCWIHRPVRWQPATIPNSILQQIPGDLNMLAILVTLAAKAEPDGSWVGYRRHLAEACQLSETTVSRKLSALAAKGVIQIRTTRREGRYAGLKIQADWMRRRRWRPPAELAAEPPDLRMPRPVLRDPFYLLLMEPSCPPCVTHVRRITPLPLDSYIEKFVSRKTRSRVVLCFKQEKLQKIEDLLKTYFALSFKENLYKENPYRKKAKIYRIQQPYRKQGEVCTVMRKHSRRENTPENREPVWIGDILQQFPWARKQTLQQENTVNSAKTPGWKRRKPRKTRGVSPAAHSQPAAPSPAAAHSPQTPAGLGWLPAAVQIQPDDPLLHDRSWLYSPPLRHIHIEAEKTRRDIDADIHKWGWQQWAKQLDQPEPEPDPETLRQQLHNLQNHLRQPNLTENNRRLLENAIRIYRTKLDNPHIPLHQLFQQTDIL